MDILEKIDEKIDEKIVKIVSSKALEKKRIREVDKMIKTLENVRVVLKAGERGSAFTFLSNVKSDITDLMGNWMKG
jgi:hypothetical protein